MHTSKLPITAVLLMNNDVIPTFEAMGARIDVVLSDDGREFCGRPDQHPYELFLQLEDIEHRTTRVKRPQSNGIVERFNRTLLDEHFCVEGRRTWFETVDDMQAVLDQYLEGYNWRRPHQGRGMKGRTPTTAFIEDLSGRTTLALPPPKSPGRDRRERRSRLLKTKLHRYPSDPAARSGACQAITFLVHAIRAKASPYN